jgi:hypothetical protein
VFLVVELSPKRPHNLLHKRRPQPLKQNPQELPLELLQELHQQRLDHKYQVAQDAVVDLLAIQILLHV